MLFKNDKNLITNTSESLSRNKHAEKATRSIKHFSKKKAHTQIKHAVFAGTLKTSLFIANMLAPRFNSPNSLTYTYIDLFAGPGKFQDEEKGSPLIAFQIFNEHLGTDGKVNNVFTKIRLVAIEKEEKDKVNLEGELDKEKQTSQCKDIIEVIIRDGDWEKHTSYIGSLLTESLWGFVFADPFSTELDIDKFIQLIEKGKSCKDFLIWANFRTLLRQATRKQGGDIERVCKSLGTTCEQLLGDNDFSDFFKTAIQKKFIKLKQFTIGVAVPVTVKEKLVSTDYFYLVCATDSLKVADGFLNAYEAELYIQKEKTEKPGSQQLSGLFESHQVSTQLQLAVLSFLKEQSRKECSLYQLLNHLFNNFLSWRTAINTKNYEVPTMKNIVSSLNTIFKLKKIEFANAADYLYKRGTPENIAGSLSYSKIMSGKHAHNIKITLKN